VIEEFCSQVAEDMNYKSNTSSESVRAGTENKDESAVSRQSGGLSVVTTTLIVTGVLLVCVVGGIILVRVVMRRRTRPKAPEYCDVYAPRASYVSVQSYAEVGAMSSYVSVQSDTDVDADSRNSTGYSYVVVH
jgi:hypothetical protein